MKLTVVSWFFFNALEDDGGGVGVRVFVLYLYVFFFNFYWCCKCDERHCVELILSSLVTKTIPFRGTECHGISAQETSQ